MFGSSNLVLPSAAEEAEEASISQAPVASEVATGADNQSRQ
jgi:hypothetical protein